MFSKMTASEFVSLIENTNGERLLEIRTWAEGNFKNKQIELKLQTFRAQKGMDNTLGEAQAKNTFAEFYLFRTNKEIEKRKMTISKSEINVGTNHGIIQQGSHNIASQNFSQNKTETITQIKHPMPTPNRKIEIAGIAIGILSIIVSIILWYFK